MSSERTYCQRCGRFAPTGHIFCGLCDAVLETVKDLEKEKKQCQERLKEFVGSDGRSWRVKVREQAFTFARKDDAKLRVIQLVNSGLWFLELEEVERL